MTPWSGIFQKTQNTGQPSHKLTLRLVTVIFKLIRSDVWNSKIIFQIHANRILAWYFLQFFIGEKFDVQTFFFEFVLFIYFFLHNFFSVYTQRCIKLIRKARAAGFESIQKTYCDKMQFKFHTSGYHTGIYAHPWNYVQMKRHTKANFSYWNLVLSGLQ